MQLDRQTLAATFDQAAELYDRARPKYPERLVADLASAVNLGRNTRAVEIGPGTGQLTTALASYGATITAVELGAGLAQVARRNLAQYPRANVVVASFDDWTPPSSDFDLITAATSWHWLDSERRAVKAASLLRPGGTLAIVTTDHVNGGTVEFFTAAQREYERWEHPSAVPGETLPDPASLSMAVDELAAVEQFGQPRVLRYLAGDHLHR